MGGGTAATGNQRLQEVVGEKDVETTEGVLGKGKIQKKQSGFNNKEHSCGKLIFGQTWDKMRTVKKGIPRYPGKTCLFQGLPHRVETRASKRREGKNRGGMAEKRTCLGHDARVSKSRRCKMNRN